MLMKSFNYDLVKNKKKTFVFSSFFILLSLIGIIYSTFYTSYKRPINLGIDFDGGYELRIERICDIKCTDISPDKILEELIKSSSQQNIINNVQLKFLNKNDLLIRTKSFLNPKESEKLINDIEEIIGPLNYDNLVSREIGPKLGPKLLKDASISLFVSLLAISLYINIRFDKKYAFFALLALFHDLFIVFGIFSWLGIILSIEVNTLFAVSLLTIAGYSVNDTVVIFDRIRENLKSQKEDYNETIQKSVNESFRRTTFTSITTLIPLLALILYGSSSLFWFSLSLSLGIIVGSYSSILLAPSFLLKD